MKSPIFAEKNKRTILKSLFPPVAALVLISGTVYYAPRAAAQPAYETFTYQAAGTEVTLVRDTGHIVIRYARESKKPRKERLIPAGFKRVKSSSLDDCDIEVMAATTVENSSLLTVERARAISEELSKGGNVQSVEHSYSQRGSREIITPTRQLLIRLSEGVSIEQVLPTKANAARKMKGTNDTYIVNYPEISTDTLLAQLSNIVAIPGVIWAEPNFVVTLKTSQLAPALNDPTYVNQWHLNNTGQDLGTAGADVGAVAAWGLLGNGGSPGVKIAVLDSGVQLDHPDIVVAENQAEVNGQDGVDDDGNGYPDDKKGIRVRRPEDLGLPTSTTDGSPDNAAANHGTPVAGVAAAIGGNGIGVAGLAYGTQILPIGLGETIIAGDYIGEFNVDNVGIAEAINYAAARTPGNSWTGAQILNLSFGYSLASSLVYDSLEWAAHSGRGGKGAVVCASSANSGAQWIRVSLTLPAYVKDITFSAAAHAGETIYLDSIEAPGAAFEGFEAAAFPPAPQTTNVQTPGWLNIQGWTRATGAFPNVFSGNAAARLVGASSGSNMEIARKADLVYVFPTGVTGGTVSFRFRVTSTSPTGLTNGYSGFRIIADGTTQLWPLGQPASDASYFGGGLGITVLGPIAAHKDVIAVGATSNTDSTSYFSQSGDGLDFVAPGGSRQFAETTTTAGIFTTDRTGADGYVSGDTVEILGTSFASPLTAGAAALLLSKEPNLPGILVRDLLRAGCEKVGSAEYVYSGDAPFGGSYNSEFGHGRLNIARSLQHLDSAWSLPANSTPGSAWAATTLGFNSGHYTWRFPTLGAYAVSAPGAFGWTGGQDRFCFVNQLFTSGNCQIIARVGGVSGASNLATGGVMIRTQNTAGAPFVFVGLRRDGGITRASRATTQGAVAFSDSLPSQASPVWVRVVATGTSISASTSSDGTAWTSAGSISGSFTIKTVGLTAINREIFPATTSVHADFDRVTVLGPLNIFAKAGSSVGYTDGAPLFAKFNLPSSVCVDNTGNIFVADTGNHRIRKIATDLNVSSIAGNGVAGSFSGTTVASLASLNTPKDVALDADGRLYILDSGNHCIRRLVLATGAISTFAGNPTQSGFAGDGGQASLAKFSNPTGFALDVDGNVYIADTGNNRVRRIDSATGIVTTIAGGGVVLGDGGQAVGAMLVAPLDVATDVFGAAYVADSGQFRVRKIDMKTGIISTIAGTGVSGYTGNNGAATSAKVGAVNGIAVDEAGNVWFSDVLNASNHRVRRIAYPTGIISAVAGVGAAGLTGDNGSGVAAKINTPLGLAVDGGGDLIFADSANHRIRRIK